MAAFSETSFVSDEASFESVAEETPNNLATASHEARIRDGGSAFADDGASSTDEEPAETSFSNSLGPEISRAAITGFSGGEVGAGAVFR
jgi:hypothetical protein